jgi:hypothetical protein
MFKYAPLLQPHQHLTQQQAAFADLQTLRVASPLAGSYRDFCGLCMLFPRIGSSTPRARSSDLLSLPQSVRLPVFDVWILLARDALAPILAALQRPHSFQQQNDINPLIYFRLQAGSMYLELPGLQQLHLAVAAAAESWRLVLKAACSNLSFAPAFCQLRTPLFLLGYLICCPRSPPLLQRQQQRRRRRRRQQQQQQQQPPPLVEK